MFLNLNHQSLDVYKVSLLFVKECYSITKKFPAEERFALVQQIRRAAISVHLNLAEGCSRKSAIERNRFFEVSRGSVIEIDSALDISAALGYCSRDGLSELGNYIVRCFGMLSKMIVRQN
jgi:four helix bundle protein